MIYELMKSSWLTGDFMLSWWNKIRDWVYVKFCNKNIALSLIVSWIFIFCLLIFNISQHWQIHPLWAHNDSTCFFMPFKNEHQFCTLNSGISAAYSAGDNTCRWREKGKKPLTLTINLFPSQLKIQVQNPVQHCWWLAIVCIGSASSDKPYRRKILWTQQLVSLHWFPKHSTNP